MKVAHKQCTLSLPRAGSLIMLEPRPGQGRVRNVRDHLGNDRNFAYDAAGRMVKEGEKTYKYGYLDKVLSVTEGSDKYTYDYHVDGQLATATYGNTTEDFLWDGLALVKRGKRGFVNEPHIGGGNPVMSSDGTTYFNDMLGTTLSSSVNGETTASSLTAFGAETHNSQLTTHNCSSGIAMEPEVTTL